jgi:hypothetical protein
MIERLIFEEVKRPAPGEASAVVEVDFGNVIVSGIRYRRWPKPNEGVLLMVGCELTLPDGIRMQEDQLVDAIDWCLTHDATTGDLFWPDSAPAYESFVRVAGDGSFVGKLPPSGGEGIRYVHA